MRFKRVKNVRYNFRKTQQELINLGDGVVFPTILRDLKIHLKV